MRPASAVLKTYGSKSSNRYPVFVTYATRGSWGEAKTREVHVAGGPPAAATAAVTSRQFFPASSVTWTFPSSVPTHNRPGLTGDSEMVVIVQNRIEGPVAAILAASLVVRSGLISSQVFPRSRDRSSICAPV